MKYIKRWIPNGRESGCSFQTMNNNRIIAKNAMIITANMFGGITFSSSAWLIKGRGIYKLDRESWSLPILSAEKVTS